MCVCVYVCVCVCVFQCLDVYVPLYVKQWVDAVTCKHDGDAPPKMMLNDSIDKIAGGLLNVMSCLGRT